MTRIDDISKLLETEKIRKEYSKINRETRFNYAKFLENELQLKLKIQEESKYLPVTMNVESAHGDSMIILYDDRSSLGINLKKEDIENLISTLQSHLKNKV